MGGEPEEISMQGGGKIVCTVLHMMNVFIEWLIGKERTIQGSNLTLFLSLPHLQFLIAYSVQRGKAKPQALFPLFVQTESKLEVERPGYSIGFIWLCC